MDSPPTQIVNLDEDSVFQRITIYVISPCKYDIVASTLRETNDSTAHMTMMFWFKTVLFFGVIFLGGVLLTVYLKEGERGE
ncbi:MAG: hypothetical protein L6300_09780 [Syntrophaceae bacterium]|nr:hypothetical protein [Pseudomonadota bacterium]MCG2740508.1 hypothetical protein [Syntrophaceae bacterium]